MLAGSAGATEVSGESNGLISDDSLNRLNVSSQDSTPLESHEDDQTVIPPITLECLASFTDDPRLSQAESQLVTLRGLRWEVAVLCGLAIMATLYVARAVFIPIMLSLVL